MTYPTYKSKFRKINEVTVKDLNTDKIHEVRGNTLSKNVFFYAEVQFVDDMIVYLKDISAEAYEEHIIKKMGYGKEFKNYKKVSESKRT